MADRYARDEKRNYRTHGTAAYDVRVPERARVQLPEEQIRPQPVRRVRAKANVSPVAVFGLAVTAFLAVLVIFCYVRLYEVDSTIASLNAQLEELQESRARLEGRYESQLNMLALENHAERLGLRKPAESQIVYLDLSGADRAVITPAEKTNVITSVFSAIRDSIQDFLEYLS